jgi:tetratricopeptide (TPR) repeat protein
MYNETRGLVNKAVSARKMMEEEILNKLQDIYVLLYVLTIMLGFVMLIWVINWISNIKSNFKNAWENNFIQLADKYYESGNYARLISHCEEKLKKYPNHSNATWWLARAELKTGNTSKAKMLFLKLLELEPSWKESHIEPYLEKLPAE